MKFFVQSARRVGTGAVRAPGMSDRGMVHPGQTVESCICIKDVTRNVPASIAAGARVRHIRDRVIRGRESI